jgi:hypothetical protein
MDSLHSRNVLLHLTGLLNINLVLVVAFLLDGEDFLVREEDVFLSVLGVCHWKRISALVRRISIKAGIRMC